MERREEPAGRDPVLDVWRGLLVRAMADLRLADALTRPTRLDALAAATGTHGPTLARLLRALAAAGLVADDAGRWRLTPAGEQLRSDTPGSQWGRVMAMVSPWSLRTWLELPESVRAGTAVFERANGLPFWDYLRTHPDASSAFDAAMASSRKGPGASELVARSTDLDAVTQLVDVAGGTGRLLASLVARRPHLRGLLADQEHVVAKAPAVFEELGVSDRCSVVAADFFEAVPSGGDAYLLSNIVHDWGDEESLRILRNVHEAAAPGARLWVLESVLPEESGDARSEHLSGYLLDLVMLMNFDARERTFDEYAELLGRAGFVDPALVRSPEGGQDLVTAVRDDT